eukprot:6473930-Amphidinium_carterae.1
MSVRLASIPLSSSIRTRFILPSSSIPYRFIPPATSHRETAASTPADAMQLARNLDRAGLRLGLLWSPSLVTKD